MPTPVTAPAEQALRQAQSWLNIRRSAKIPMKPSIALFAMCLAFASSTAVAQSSGPNLDFAFEQLKTNGAEPFAKYLYEANPENSRAVAAQLSSLAKGKGDYLGYEVISRVRLTKRVERVTIVINFETCPIYMRIDLYDSIKTKLCMPAVLSREATDILPFDLISAAGK